MNFGLDELEFEMFRVIGPCEDQVLHLPGNKVLDKKLQTVLESNCGSKSSTVAALIAQAHVHPLGCGVGASAGNGNALQLCISRPCS